MDLIDILIQAYYTLLNGLGLTYNNVSIPVYTKFLPSTETAPCYVLISDVTGNRYSVKGTKAKTADVQIGVYSQDASIDPDKVMAQVDAAILDNENNSLITMPSGFQTWIENDTDNSQTLQLSKNALYLNRFKTYSHKIFITS